MRRGRGAADGRVGGGEEGRWGSSPAREEEAVGGGGLVLEVGEGRAWGGRGSYGRERWGAVSWGGRRGAERGSVGSGGGQGEGRERAREGLPCQGGARV